VFFLFLFIFIFIFTFLFLFFCFVSFIQLSLEKKNKKGKKGNSVKNFFEISFYYCPYCLWLLRFFVFSFSFTFLIFFVLGEESFSKAFDWLKRFFSKEDFPFSKKTFNCFNCWDGRKVLNREKVWGEGTKLDKKECKKKTNNKNQDEINFHQKKK